MCKSNINEIFDILTDAKIRSYNDLYKLELERDKLISARKYPWIGRIAKNIDLLYDSTDIHIQKTDGQIFLVDEISEFSHNNIFNYSCVFPDRMIISAGEFHFLEDEKNALVDISLLKKLFWGKELILNNIVRISPFYRCTNINDGDGDFKNSILEYLSLPDENKSKIAQLDKAGIKGIEHINFVDKIVVAFPWLHNAKPQDYLKIIEDNRKEFELYNIALAKLSSESANTEQFLKSFEYNLKEANINITMALEKEKNKLYKKGIATTIGICLTGIPVLFKNQINSPEMLSALLGTVSGFEIIKGIAETTSSIKYEGKDNPYWVLWKWYSKTMKRQ